MEQMWNYCFQTKYSATNVVGENDVGKNVRDVKTDVYGSSVAKEYVP
jgi:hypothetical protein